MPISTNVPPISWDPATGYTAPPQQAVLAGMQADMDQAFGGGLNPALNTPQGQLASSQTAIVAQANDTFVGMANQVDPAHAEGRFQDAIGRIYFLERNPAEPTAVQALCTGLTGVVIPMGALAKAQDGQIYICTEGGVIADTGQVTLPFACLVPGPIACPAGALNTIYQAINGWDSIINLTDGVLGNDVESRSAFEERRAASVALNSRGSIEAIRGAVLDVSGVLDAYVYDNVEESPVTIGGATLAPKSVYVAAVGGSPESVAKAIWTKKAPGCGYNGNTTIVVFDENPGYAPPYPEYLVSFEIPPALPILFVVNIATNPQVPSDAVTLIQNAIIAAFAGADGGPRARIGSTIYATRFVAPIAALGAWAQIALIAVGSNNSPAATFTGSISGTTLTVTAVSQGAIAIGQTISDGDGAILPGTKITAGGGSSWTVSVSQEVPAREIKSAVPALGSAVVNINQVPTISANNIAVMLL